MAQNNQFSAVISNITGKKYNLGEETSSVVFNILLTLNSSCTFLFLLTQRESLKAFLTNRENPWKIPLEGVYFLVKLYPRSLQL